MAFFARDVLKRHDGGLPRVMKGCGGLCAGVGMEDFDAQRATGDHRGSAGSECQHMRRASGGRALN